jgi:hypothetical protein
MNQSAAAPTGREFFFPAMALVMAGIVFAGFAPTFYLGGALGGPTLTPLATAHGVIFSLWVLLFVAQPALVRRGRVDAHRVLGAAGGALAAGMVLIGVATALVAAARGHAPGGGDPRSFLIYPLGGICAFATTVAAAIHFRQAPDIHKRLMLIANISLLDPAIARFPFSFLAAHPLVPFGLACLVAAALAIYDFAVIGRIHRATLVAGSLTAAWQPIAYAINGTPWWLGFADFAVAVGCGAWPALCPSG